jgi:hypothetical protein
MYFVPVFNQTIAIDKKVVSVFVRFRAPLPTARVITRISSLTGCYKTAGRYN